MYPLSDRPLEANADCALTLPGHSMRPGHEREGPGGLGRCLWPRLPSRAAGSAGHFCPWRPVLLAWGVFCTLGAWQARVPWSPHPGWPSEATDQRDRR